MGETTCTTCGAEVGDEELHRQWHAGQHVAQPAGSEPAAGERPTTNHPTDAAPYSA